MSGLCFPLKVLDAHAAVLGKTGAGKSSAMRHVVEYLLSHNKRVVIIDPKGDWWGLKSDATGKGPGFPIVAFGTFKSDEDVADVPINEESGKDVAELIVGGNRPAIIGFRGWYTAHMLKFWIDFAKGLFHGNQGELYLFIDEIQNFAPKGSTRTIEGQGGLALHWANRMLAEGRGLGINIWIGSQRPQKVHNDTLDGCETLVAMRSVHPAARGEINDWMNGAQDKEKSAVVLDALGAMKRGEAIIWSPEIEFGPQKVEFPMFTTFDSFAPPQLQKKVHRKDWATVDLDEVKIKLARIVEEKEQNDPVKLNQRIRTLERDLASTAQRSQATPQAKAETVEVPILTERELKVFENGEHALKQQLDVVITTLDAVRAQVAKVEDKADARRAMIDGIRTTLSRVAPVPAATPRPGGREAVAARGGTTSGDGTRRPAGRADQAESHGDTGDFRPNKKQQEILDALAWYESIGNRAPRGTQLGAVALIDTTGGYFSNMMGPLCSASLVTRGNGTFSLTDAGRAMASVPERTASIEDYHEVLRRRIRKMKQAGGKTIEMLNFIIGLRGGETTTRDIGAGVSIDPSGGYFSNMFGPLVTAGVVERDRSGTVCPTDVLFPPGIQ